MTPSLETISHIPRRTSSPGEFTPGPDGKNHSGVTEPWLKRVRDSDATAVVLDCSALDYISSFGLRVILVIAKLLRERDVEFLLCFVHGPTREVFAVSGFDRILALHSSPDEALEALAT